MSAPPDLEEPPRALRPSDSSRTLHSFINAYDDAWRTKQSGSHDSSSAASTTLTLVDASTQTYWTSEAATQTEVKNEKFTNVNLKSEAVAPSTRQSQRPCFGLFGKVCFLSEAEDPKAYPSKIKWFITLTVALAAAAAPLGSAIIFRESKTSDSGLCNH